MAKKPRADLMPLANYESIFETDDKDGESRTKLCSRERWWLLFLTASILCVGCLTTYFATKHLSNKKCNLDQDNLPDHIQRDEIHKQILSEINAENLEKYLRYENSRFTQHSTSVGTPVIILCLPTSMATRPAGAKHNSIIPGG